MLARIGGGVTIMSPAEGGWYDWETERIIWEQPMLIHTYVKPEPFLRYLGVLREFLPRLGCESDRGEVVCEFDGVFYRIKEFDDPEDA